jgi:hypothetical protein
MDAWVDDGDGGVGGAGGKVLVSMPGAARACAILLGLRCICT